MKKLSLLILLLNCLVIHSLAQTISVNSPTISVDATNSQYPLDPQPGISKGKGSAVPDTTKRTRIWIETGTGNFLTVPPVTPYTVNGNLKHEPFMLATNLYDTTKDDIATPIRPSRINNDHNPLSPGLITSPITSIFQGSNTGVKITPNAYDIVRGDTMAFAITYKTPETGAIGPIGGNPVAYKLYFFYNNEETFEEVTIPNRIIRGTTSFSIKQCRMHNNETPTTSISGLPTTLDKYRLLKSVCFDIPSNQGNERNVFITMIPLPDLVTGNSGSVYAVLTDAKGNELQSDSIVNMRFGPAHDPNYLVQQPYCLLKPKKVYPFNYTVHFQNTGEGDAERVKVVIHLPKGLDYNSYHLKKIVFAGANTNITPIIDNTNNTLLYDFKIGSPLLKGTGNFINPASNPQQTMGEIQFTINSTPNTDETLKAYAEIYFKSVYKSNNTIASNDPEFGDFEQPVRTNTEVSKYSDDCACRDCPCAKKCPPTCCHFLGLCWWWWILIFFVIVFIIYFLLRRRKKQYNRQGYN